MRSESHIVRVVAIALAAVIAGCAASSGPPAEPTGPVFSTGPSDPVATRQIMADSAFLEKNRLPKPPVGSDAPASDAKACPAAQVHNRGSHQLVVPPDLATAMVLHDAKPWAFVRYDVDADGTPLNAEIAATAGLKSFERAALETVSGWRFDLSGGLKEAHGCVSYLALS